MKISIRAQILIISCLTILAYSNVFQNGFVIDDKSFIGWEEGHHLSNIGTFFKGVVPPGQEGVYRPIRSVFYAFYYQIFGSNPFWYHLHSLLVHLTCTVLVYFIVRELIGKGKEASIVKGLGLGKKDETSNLTSKPNRHLNPYLFTLPFLTALLFGLHPIHTETITYIASSMDVLGIFFFFASFWIYLLSFTSEVKKMQLHLRGVSLVFAIMAFFTNETTLVLPLLLVFYELCFNFRGIRGIWEIWGKRKRVLLYFVGALGYLFVRFFTLHISSRGPYLANSIYLTALTMVKVFIKYITLTIFPINQVNNHTLPGGIEAFIYRGYNPDPIKAQNLSNPDFLISLLILIVIIFLAIKAYKKYPIITFGIGWFFISLLPVSEIVPQGSILGERFLYIPSFGFVLILGYLFSVIPDFDPGSIFRSKRWIPAFARLVFASSKRAGMTIKKPYFFIVFYFLLITFYFYLTYQRNKAWHDEITFWKVDIGVYPKTNGYAYFQLGNQYKALGQYSLALTNYDQAVKINPHFAVAEASKGLVYEQEKKWDLAIEAYKKAIGADPLFWEGYVKMESLYKLIGRDDLAKEQNVKLQNLINQLNSKNP